jgi:hypothetical protein
MKPTWTTRLSLAPTCVIALLAPLQAVQARPCDEYQREMWVEQRNIAAYEGVLRVEKRPARRAQLEFGVDQFRRAYSSLETQYDNCLHHTQKVNHYTPPKTSHSKIISNGGTNIWMGQTSASPPRH